MAWTVVVTKEFEVWHRGLNVREVSALQNAVALLRAAGPAMGRPHVDTVHGSHHRNMKELRIQVKGNPLRVFFAFDPYRRAVLLIGGDKTGRDRFYQEMIRLADRLFDEHLQQSARQRAARRNDA